MTMPRGELLELVEDRTGATEREEARREITEYIEGFTIDNEYRLK